MPSVNDVLCILIIPFLDYLVYPHIERSMKLKLQPIHKVSKNGFIIFLKNIILLQLVAGMLCAAYSFLMAGIYISGVMKVCVCVCVCVYRC